MRRILASIFTAAAVVTSKQAPPLGCTGVRNEKPILELPAQPLKTVPNGQSWVMQEGNNVVYFAKLSGSPYEMGYAYGQLYGPEIANNLNNIVIYAKEKIEGMLSNFGLSQFIMDLLWGQIEQLLFFLLDLNQQIALPYIPQRFIDEIKGIADGSNGTVSETMLIRANMLPELT